MSSADAKVTDATARRDEKVDDDDGSVASNAERGTADGSKWGGGDSDSQADADAAAVAAAASFKASARNILKEAIEWKRFRTQRFSINRREKK
jgi:hypothetical protein